MDVVGFLSTTLDQLELRSDASPVSTPSTWGRPPPLPTAEEQWDDLIEQVPSYSQGWQTPEHILVPPVFGESALDGLDFLQTYPGIPPFLRGPVRHHVRQPTVDDPAVRRLLDR